MSVAVITGSAGLIGSEAVRFFAGLGMQVIGIDNDMRQFFFGEEASTRWNRVRLEQQVPNYIHHDLDIRDAPAIERLFAHYGSEIALIVHTAAQPSHDWAARDPYSDFSVNALGTLNLLQAARQHAPTAPFIFTSTNKVYGDRPNLLPLLERETRWDIDPVHPARHGIAEDMSIDQSKHSLFGASKVAADVLVQEYGRYFDMPTVCFRGGCLTGPSHSGTQLHGFLAYLMKCTMSGKPYTVFGYKGKQVRDNIHSADLIAAFHAFYRNPRAGEVYNIGGGLESNCSMLEAIALCQEIAGRELHYSYVDDNRSGDHIWYISDLRKFKSHYPDWAITYDVPRILQEMYAVNQERWVGA
ncbi:MULTISPECIES: NAD-dependent epimerase/dehydratase family protein [Deinococcus]|uniref:NAD-dependent epimerase/dehydratase n=1 Tax=Deinococcus geothermalis (strain DSM 11300 / CIP 105573 / AG-3a) TaxID=319795 RepID=Q1J355_DEIGD|nr:MULTISPECIES: NAD-dependent epimerase/dehydratase family protein [Deinococcus]ABF44079.1 NAD-dependent epimerase/dehydratase [Deinococcus geothermalis DSM 11300]MBI0446293.1 NAD-dependent epimerase/dehydratase family protein [Deinococcus sp. DB0503]